MEWPKWYCSGGFHLWYHDIDLGRKLSEVNSICLWKWSLCNDRNPASGTFGCNSTLNSQDQYLLWQWKLISLNLGRSHTQYSLTSRLHDFALRSGDTAALQWYLSVHRSSTGIFNPTAGWVICRDQLSATIYSFYFDSFYFLTLAEMGK